MTQAVAVRREGDAFQARVFWRKAACLLDPSGPIVQVGFESGPRGFDDIWVAYAPDHAPNDHAGNPILREHIQCKWHVSVNDFGYADLINPEWINANKVSLLQRARDAQVEYAPTGIGERFKLLTNWTVARADPLRRLIAQRSKALHINKLFDDTGDASWSGKVRKLWREHLDIDDRELRVLVRTLSIDTDSTSLDDHRDNLNIHFENRGLKCIPMNESSFIYDEVVFQWLSQGRLEFDRRTFREACRRENLLAGEGRTHIVFGVKSFEHAFDRLEERCASTLDLVCHFDDRTVREQSEWVTTLYPKLLGFLQNAAKDTQFLRLVLDAHTTLAYAAGSVLNIKSARSIEIEQRTVSRSIWHPNDITHDTSWPSWQFSLVHLQDSEGEMAVAVSLTHDVEPAVTTHLASFAPSVSTLLVARLTCGPGARSVVCGQHAFDLAGSLALEINRRRASNNSPLHFFIAAPNAFTFFFGQRQPSLGRTQLYEYDFEGINGGGYRLSLGLPI